MKAAGLTLEGLLADPAQQLGNSYVSNNPLRWVDPLGLWTFGVGFSFTGNLPGKVGTVGVQAVFDDDGNFDVQVTWGTGATTSTTSGGSATLDVTATNADTVDDLNGPGLEKNVSYNPARVAFTQSIHATSGYLGSTTSLGIGLGKNPAGFSVNTMATFTRSPASSRSNAPCP